MPDWSLKSETFLSALSHAKYISIDAIAIRIPPDASVGQPILREDSFFGAFQKLTQLKQQKKIYIMPTIFHHPLVVLVPFFFAFILVPSTWDFTLVLYVLLVSVLAWIYVRFRWMMQQDHPKVTLPPPLVRLGLIADVQYADKDDKLCFDG
jgi:hypothetical protein